MADQSIHLCRLSHPVVSDLQDEFWGCFSWVDVPVRGSFEELIAAATPVLDNAAFAMKQQQCREGLQSLTDVTELQFSRT